MKARHDPWIEVLGEIDARVAGLTTTLRQLEQRDLPAREPGLPSPRYQEGGPPTEPEQRQVELVTAQIRLLSDLREAIVRRQLQVPTSWLAHRRADASSPVSTRLVIFLISVAIAFGAVLAELANVLVPALLHR
jgi:hypothetical protein